MSAILIFKIEIFNSQVLQKQVLHQLAKCFGDRSHFHRDIAVFRVFLVKCKNSLDDRAYCRIGLTLQKLEVTE